MQNEKSVIIDLVERPGTWKFMFKKLSRTSVVSTLQLRRNKNDQECLLDSVHIIMQQTLFILLFTISMLRDM